MKPYFSEEVPSLVWDIFGNIKLVLEEMPDYIVTPAYLFGIRLPEDMAIGNLSPSCHMVTRALTHFFPVMVHDGYVVLRDTSGLERPKEHSWLSVLGCDERFIIDPWPLGVVSGPALYIQDVGLHFGHECSFLHTKTEEFESKVMSIITVMANTSLPKKQSQLA